MSSPRPRILVIDDDPMSVSIAEEVLGVDHVVLAASSGTEGLELARAERPDIVLLDIVMPDLDGFEVCRRMRATPELASTKILLVSGRGEPAERLEGYQAGADDHVTKPVDGAELLAKVRVYLRLKGAEEMERMKSDLLDLLAHEIRTPLSAIMPATEMLNGDYTLSEDERRMLLRAIGEGARRLLRLTERAVVLQRARSGGLQLRRRNIDLSELLRSAIQNSPPVRVVTCEKAMVHGDATLVTLAIEELIAHAVQNSVQAPVVELFAPGPDGTARLRIGHAGAAACTVGTKLDLAPLSADVRDGQTVGAHLGLPTADVIATAHGGGLWNVSTPGGLGSVELRLPAASR